MQFKIQKTQIFTIHFHKQLIKCILLFTLPPKVASSSLPSYSIYFINEENARGILPSQGK